MIRSKFLILILLAAAVLSFAACAQAPDNSTQVATLENSTAGGNGTAPSNAANRSVAAAPMPQDTNAVALDRKIIRNAEMTLETTSPDEAQQRVTGIVESKGGFVIEAQKSTTNAKTTSHDRVTMTLRIPEAKFTETLDEIKQASGRVLVETVRGQDVTEEFVDVEARLKVKKAAEEQFLEILKQAKSIADTLAVQKELTEVRSEIEQIEGRKRVLENQTSLSTIRLTLQKPTVFSANSSGFVYQLGQALSNGFEAALNFILGFITVIIAILPFLVLVVLPICLVLRYFWNRIKKRALANKLANEQRAEEKAKAEQS